MLMKDGNRATRRTYVCVAGQCPKGPVGYQEVGCATMPFCDAPGECLDTRRMGRMPQPKKPTLKNALSADLEVTLGKRPDLNVVKIADGAHHNWSYLGALVPEASAVVDFYHATEQVKAALDARQGDNGARVRAQFEKLHHVLRDDSSEVERVVGSLNYQRKRYQQRKRIGEVLGYFGATATACATSTPVLAISSSARPVVEADLQDAGHSAPEALRHAIASCRRTSHPDAARPGTSERFNRAWTLPSNTIAQNSSSRTTSLLSSATRGVMYQFRTHTRGKN